MRLLEKEFILKGFRFTQMEGNENFTIYLKENNVPVDSLSYYYCYEVIKIIKRNAESFNRFSTQIEMPSRELYPNDNNWGLQGWTFQDLPTAEGYFIKLSEKVDSTELMRVKKQHI